MSVPQIYLEFIQFLMTTIRYYFSPSTSHNKNSFMILDKMTNTGKDKDGSGNNKRPIDDILDEGKESENMAPEAALAAPATNVTKAAV